jgi:hypothetical protein
MTEDPNRREPVRLMTSTRAAAMWLALLAVVLGGVLLLTLWSTGLAADRSLPWRWGSVATAALGFLFLAWAMITAFGVFTHASASPADPGFLSVRPPIPRSRSRDDLQELLYRTAMLLGAEVYSSEQKPGQDSARTAATQATSAPAEGKPGQGTEERPSHPPAEKLNFECARPGDPLRSWVVRAGCRARYFPRWPERATAEVPGISLSSGIWPASSAKSLGSQGMAARSWRALGDRRAGHNRGRAAPCLRTCSASVTRAWAVRVAGCYFAVRVAGCYFAVRVAGSYFAVRVARSYFAVRVARSYFAVRVARSYF